MKRWYDKRDDFSWPEALTVAAVCIGCVVLTIVLLATMIPVITS